MIDLGPGAPVAVVDVGGTDIKTGVVDAGGALADVAHQPTPGGPGVIEAIIDAAEAHLAQVRRARTVEALGLVVPGIVDDERGVAIRSENLGWRDVAFLDLAQARLGVPVGFGHDVTAAGLAETSVGAAAGVRDAAVVVIGTGIAATLVTDGRPIRSGGYAGELGHSIVADGPACVCGARGCLEAIASTAALARRYTELTGTAVDGAREVLARATAGEEVARQVWQAGTRALAAGLRQLAAVTAPEVIVLGGGLSKAGESLLGPLRAQIDRTFPPLRIPRLRQTTLGGYGGLVGAAQLARAALR